MADLMIAVLYFFVWVGTGTLAGSTRGYSFAGETRKEADAYRGGGGGTPTPRLLVVRS